MTTIEFSRERIQNHDRFTCPACGSRVMRSRNLYRYTAGSLVVTQCTSCPAPSAPAASVPVVAAPAGPAAPAPRFYRCRCGNAGYAGRHPFTTAPHIGCDDCL